MLRKILITAAIALVGLMAFGGVALADLDPEAPGVIALEPAQNNLDAHAESAGSVAVQAETAEEFTPLGTDVEYSGVSVLGPIAIGWAALCIGLTLFYFGTRTIIRRNGGKALAGRADPPLTVG